MVGKVTIMDRIEVYANSGEISAPLKLWKSQISSLKKDGFDVSVVSPTERKGEFYCNISWKNPKGGEARYMLSATISGLTRNLQNSLKNNE